MVVFEEPGDGEPNNTKEYCATRVCMDGAEDDAKTVHCQGRCLVFQFIVV